MTFTTFGLGWIAKIRDPHLFKQIALFLRFFQGQGDVMIQFTGYAAITSVFKNHLLKYIGYIEIVVGLGLGLGPMVGALVYPNLRYEGTMYFFGGLNFVTMMICYLLIPQKLDSDYKNSFIRGPYSEKAEEQKA
jgi:MFS family permease